MAATKKRSGPITDEELKTLLGSLVADGRFSYSRGEGDASELVIIEIKNRDKRFVLFPKFLTPSSRDEDGEEFNYQIIETQKTKMLGLAKRLKAIPVYVGWNQDHDVLLAVLRGKIEQAANQGSVFWNHTWLPKFEKALKATVAFHPLRDGDQFTHFFLMDQLASYLLCLAAGDVIDDKTGKALAPVTEVNGDVLLLDLASVASKLDSGAKTESQFKGFTANAFALLSVFAKSPTKDTFQANKEKFTVELREPLSSLMGEVSVDALKILGPEIETSTNILSRIQKNDFGKGGIHSHYWASFYPSESSRLETSQLFVILRENKLTYGLGFGIKSEQFVERFRRTWAKVITDDYCETLDALKINLQLRAPNGTEAYRGKVTRVELERLNADESLIPQFVVELTADEVVALKEQLSDHVKRAFLALLPLFITASFDNYQRRLDTWEKYVSDEVHEGGDEDTSGAAILSMPAPKWEDVLSAMNWAPGGDEAQHVRRLLDQALTPATGQDLQFIFYGPPGTGKTRAALEVAKHFATSPVHIQRVQFHQSYGYEQFIEGIRPVPKNGQISYETVSGPFTRFCQIAKKREDSGERFVFIIDEINRGNVSRIFGELMFLLEYRDQELPLLYSNEPFRIPKNVTIIATMNSADRSIALIDYALRRRFRFIEFQPRVEVLASWYSAPKSNKEHQQCLSFFSLLNSKFSDPRLAIGHSYFLDATSRTTGLTKAKLRQIWDSSIWPLLQEYFVSMPSRLADFAFEELWEKSAEGVNEQPAPKKGEVA